MAPRRQRSPGASIAISTTRASSLRPSRQSSRRDCRRRHNKLVGKIKSLPSGRLFHSWPRRLVVFFLALVAADNPVLDIHHAVRVFGDVVLVGDENDGVAFA